MRRPAVGVTCPACSGGSGPLCPACTAKVQVIAPAAARGVVSAPLALRRLQPCPGASWSTALGRRPMQAQHPLCGGRVPPVLPVDS